MSESEIELSASDLRLGQQIRDLRKAKGITLQVLAERIGKSVGYVSQVERGVSTLPVPVLQDISDVLEVKISWFFHSDARQADHEFGRIVRAGGRRSLDFAGTGIHEELLSPTLSGELLMIMTSFAPQSRTDRALRKRSAEEAVLVVEGKIRLHIGEHDYDLDVGDSFVLQPHDDYLLENDSQDSTARLLWVIGSSNY